jgi:hypothetical protein
MVHCVGDRNNWWTIIYSAGGGRGCNFALHETLIFSTLEIEMNASIRPMVVKRTKITYMFLNMTASQNLIFGIKNACSL